MKKNLLTVCICAILSIFAAKSYAQKLSFGEYTGINFSNLHGNLTSNKWVPKAGPLAGLFVEYSLGRSFSVQSEIGYTSQYYEMKTYKQQPSYPTVMPWSYSSCCPSPNIWAPVYESNKWDFSFLRFPLLIKYKTPTRLQLGIGGGMFYSILMNDNLTKDERNAVEKEGRDVYPPTHDWGYLFTADLSYPIIKNLRFFLAGRLTTGQKVFVENYKAKNGASELLVGLKYTPERRNNKIKLDFNPSESDSSFFRCYIKPVAGVIMSWNSATKKPGNYSPKPGPNTGIILGYQLDKTVSIQTGVMFERKGYALADSSLSYHRFASDTRYQANQIDTKTELDYLTIPLNLRFSYGNPFTFYFDLGTYAGFMANAICHGTAIKKYTGSNNYTIEKININDAVEGYYKSVDWGYQAGLGLQFPFRDKIKFDVGISYSKSFSPILQTPDAGANVYRNDDLSIKNGSLSLQFGIQIPIAN